MDEQKQQVYHFWNQASCGEVLYLNQATPAAYARQAEQRYALEPMIKEFAQFTDYKDQDVLEIGVGLGAEHQQFAQAGARLHGIDLTQRAIEHTQQRLSSSQLTSNLQVADAEQLPFADQSFDLVYSWGVLHHTPNTAKAIEEVYRVLKVGGEAKLMIYHKYSMVGYMLWLRYALLTGRPYKTLSDIYAQYLESPGTKAYSIKEARALLQSFQSVTITTMLTHGDLLTSAVGQRHKGWCLTLAKKLWPRWLIKSFCPTHGLFMLIHAKRT